MHCAAAAWMSPLFRIVVSARPRIRNYCRCRCKNNACCSPTTPIFLRSQMIWRNVRSRSRQSCFGPSSEEPFGICYRVLFPWRAKRTTREYVLECTTSSRGQSLRWRRVEKALDWLSPFVISNSWFPVTNPSSPNPRISTKKFKTICNPFATVGECLSWTTGNETSCR